MYFFYLLLCCCCCQISTINISWQREMMKLSRVIRIHAEMVENVFRMAMWIAVNVLDISPDGNGSTKTKLTNQTTIHSVAVQTTTIFNFSLFFPHFSCSLLLFSMHQILCANNVRIGAMHFREMRTHTNIVQSLYFSKPQFSTNAKCWHDISSNGQPQQCI